MGMLASYCEPLGVWAQYIDVLYDVLYVFQEQLSFFLNVEQPSLRVWDSDADGLCYLEAIILKWVMVCIVSDNNAGVDLVV